MVLGSNDFRKNSLLQTTLTLPFVTSDPWLSAILYVFSKAHTALLRSVSVKGTGCLSEEGKGSASSVDALEPSASVLELCDWEQVILLTFRVSSPANSHVLPVCLKMI